MTIFKKKSLKDSLQLWMTPVQLRIASYDFYAVICMCNWVCWINI